MSKLSQALRVLRVKSGLRNYEIAEKLGITPAAVSGHMSETNPYTPSLEMLIKYSEVFKEPLENLIKAIKEDDTEVIVDEDEKHLKVAESAADYKYPDRGEDYNPGEYITKINKLLIALEESGDKDALRVIYRFINDISTILDSKASQ